MEDLSEADLFLLIEQNKNISSAINKNFIDILAVSGLFTITDFSDIPKEEAEKNKKMFKYSVCPEITEFEITESETSGLFLKIKIIFTIEDNNNTQEEIPVSAIGWGKNRRELIANTLKNIGNQFEYVIAAFEELADNFRIIDIYQGSIVINKGKNKNIKKGDFLYSYDYATGKKTGTFVVDRTEWDLSYARILDTKKSPETEDPLKSYKYLGVLLTTYMDYFSGDFFSGNIYGGMIIWTRGLYTVNPILGLNIYDVIDIENKKVVVLAPYAGLRIVRYINSFSLSSIITFNRGYLLESEVDGMVPGWEYFGGTVKLEIAKRFFKHFLIHAEGGYTGLISPDHENYKEITGFFFGAGIGLKF